MEVWQAELEESREDGWMRGERESKLKMQMTADKGSDNDDDDGDLAVCSEIILQLPAIRLQTTAAVQNANAYGTTDRAVTMTFSQCRKLTQKVEINYISKDAVTSKTLAFIQRYAFEIKSIYNVKRFVFQQKMPFYCQTTSMNLTLRVLSGESLHYIGTEHSDK